MPKRKLPKKRNPLARNLTDPRYRKRVEKKRKGKGSYDRNQEKDLSDATHQPIDGDAGG